MASTIVWYHSFSRKFNASVTINLLQQKSVHSTKRIRDGRTDGRTGNGSMVVKISNYIYNSKCVWQYAHLSVSTRSIVCVRPLVICLHIRSCVCQSGRLPVDLWVLMKRVCLSLTFNTRRGWAPSGVVVRRTDWLHNVIVETNCTQQMKIQTQRRCRRRLDGNEDHSHSPTTTKGPSKEGMG